MRSHPKFFFHILLVRSELQCFFVKLGEKPTVTTPGDSELGDGESAE